MKMFKMAKVNMALLPWGLYQPECQNKQMLFCIFKWQLFVSCVSEAPVFRCPWTVVTVLRQMDNYKTLLGLVISKTSQLLFKAGIRCHSFPFATVPNTSARHLVRTDCGRLSDDSLPSVPVCLWQGAGGVLRQWKHLQGATQAFLYQEPKIKWVDCEVTLLKTLTHKLKVLTHQTMG